MVNYQTLSSGWVWLSVSLSPLSSRLRWSLRRTTTFTCPGLWVWDVEWGGGWYFLSPSSGDWKEGELVFLDCLSASFPRNSSVESLDDSDKTSWIVCCNFGLGSFEVERRGRAPPRPPLPPSSSEDLLSVAERSAVVAVAAAATLRSVTGPRFRQAATYRSSLTPGMKSECGRGCEAEEAPLSEGHRWRVGWRWIGVVAVAADGCAWLTPLTPRLLSSLVPLLLRKGFIFDGERRSDWSRRMSADRVFSRARCPECGRTENTRKD